MGLALSHLTSFVVGVGTASVFWLWLFQTQYRRPNEQSGESWLEQRLPLNTPGNASMTPTFAQTTGRQDTSFLSAMMRGLWSDVRVVAEASIRVVLSEALHQNSIGCTLHTLDLGDTPPRFENVIVKERKGNSLQMDMDVIWNAAVKIRFATALGKFGIRALFLRGRMSIVFMPLTSDDPTIVQALQYSFINTPDLKLDFSGLASIADLKVLERKIHEAIAQTIDSMCVLPRRMPFPLAENYSLMDMYRPPLGVARVTLLRGRGFQVQKGRFAQKDDVPDVYCNIQLGPTEPNNPVWRTATIRDCLSPVWKDTCRDFLLCDFDQLLSIHAWDEDNGPLDGDDDLGRTKITVGELLLGGGTRELELYDDKGQTTGCFISVHCAHIPISSDLRSLDPTTDATKNKFSGLLSVIVSNGANLPIQSSRNAIRVDVSVNDGDSGSGPIHFSTPAFSEDAANPHFDSVFSSLVQRPQSVTLTLYNRKQLIATATVSRDQLLSAEHHCVVQNKNVGKDGWFRFSVRLYGFQELPVSIQPSNDGAVPITISPSSESVESLLQTTPLLGCKTTRTVRITLLRGYGFEIQRFRFKKDDIPDVYCQIIFNQAHWRTKTVRDSTTPEFNEARDFMLQSTNHIVSLDVFDEDKHSKDDELGSVSITIGRLLLAPATEVEVQHNGRGYGAFLVLSAELIEEDNSRGKDD